MGSPLHGQEYQPSSSDKHPVKNITNICSSRNIASPVVNTMLHMISKKFVPSGFDSEGFVKRSFLEIFGKGNQATTCSASEWDSISTLAKRKRSSVVDSALGIMGYNSQKVCETKGRFLVDMLTSLIHMKLRDQFCAQRISVATFLQIVDNCKSFFASVQDDGTQAQEVMDALMKVATDTCLFTPRAESVSGVFTRTVYEKDGQKSKDNIWALQSVLDFALEQKHSIYSKLRPCSRLRVWRIRPSRLKQDISSLANEAMQRLLLPLDRDLRQREEWTILVVCLSLAPEVFREARRLLHHWLLSSGAVRLWQLRAELVAAVLDVVSHPSVWGLRSDIHLPSKFAYYCVELRPCVQILEGPPTIQGVLRLLKFLDNAEGLQRKAASGKSPLVQDCNDVDHNSIWSLLIEFFPWFVFATKLLFRNFKPTETSSSGREMYESLVCSGKLEGVRFETEDDSEHFGSKVAARYLAWIISPGNRLQRASDKEMLLLLNRSWVKVRDSLYHETSSRLCDLHDYGEITVAVQACCTKCTKCGSPVTDVKAVTDEGSDGICGKKEAPNSYGMESSLTLKLWLGHIQRTFEVFNTTTYTEEELNAGGEDPSRMGRSSIANSAGKSANFMAHYLPLAALSESLPICTLDTVISVLQFVTSCRGQTAQSNEHCHQGGYEARGPCFLECNSCRALPHNERCPSQRKGDTQAGPPVSSDERDNTRDSTGRSGLHLKMSPDWIPGVAAAFGILDSLDGDVLLLADSSLSVDDPRGDKGRVTDNLAAIVAEYVKEWAKSLEAFPSETLPSFEENTIYRIALEDMQCRFCRWIDKLSLTEEAANVCNDLSRNLAKQINFVKSCPLTP